MSTPKLCSTGFLVLALGALLLASGGIAYLLAESKEGGSMRPVTTTVGEPLPSNTQNIPPGVISGQTSQPDANHRVSPGIRNALIGMIMGGVCLFAGSVLIFVHKKELVCPTCHAHSLRSGEGEDPAAKQAVRNLERREP